MIVEGGGWVVAATVVMPKGVGVATTMAVVVL